MSRYLPVVLLLFCFHGAVAQTSRSKIAGTVLDSTGAAVPGASVKAEAPAIGVERATVTNESGFFTLVNLPNGIYNVSVEHPGFKTAANNGLTLNTDAVLDLSFSLAVGQVTERVEVTADAPLVEVSSGEISRLISGTQIQSLALAGRNPYMMLGLVPGVVARGGTFLNDFRATSFSMGGLQVNGQRKDSNFNTIDGISNTRSRDGVQVNNILGIDFIEEVKILTTHYAAEHGRTSGAQINFVTRRGTNQYHMSAYNFLLNDRLNAKQFVVGTKPSVRYNDFGYTVGGPIYIPKKWNTDRNKMFFFVGQEYRRLGGFNQKFGIVPTALERSGDFSASAVKPRDPLTGALFPGNIIPANRISGVGKAIQKLYPDPNYTGPGGNFYTARRQPTNSDDIIGRIDYNIKPNWQLSGRALHGNQDFTSPYDNTGNNIPLFEVNRGRSGNNYVVAFTTTLGAKSVNELSYGYSDYRETFAVLGNGALRATYGFTFPELYAGNRLERIPNINIANHTGVSGSGHPTFARTPTFTIRENYSRVMGSHNLKAGFYLERLNMNELNQATDAGVFNFGNSSANPLNSGHPVANALLGNFDSYSEQGTPVQTVYKTQVAELYVQDSWRLRPNLTLEFGLRHSVIPPWYSLWNNMSVFMASAWDRSKIPTVLANGSILPGSGDIYSGVVLPGGGFPDSASGRVPQAADANLTRLFRGKSRGFMPTRWNNFQPRVSFAWDPFRNGKTSVRGGFGAFNGIQGIANSGMLNGGRPPFTQAATITNGSADAPASGLPVNVQFPLDLSSLPDEWKVQTVYNYSFGIQRQLPFRTSLDISYVGNSGRHLVQSRPLNFLSPDVIRANQGVDTRRFLPYHGLGGLGIVEPSGTSSYNSMQIAVNRRAQNGLLIGVAYTLGKIIGYGNEGVAGGPQDPTTLRPERSELEESRRHNFVMQHAYPLPFFKQQKGVFGRILGGWEVSGVMVFNDGRLFAPGLNAAPRQIATRPNVLRNWELPSEQQSLFRYFDTTAFARPAEFTYGNAGKWIIRGPGTFNWDGFILKDIRIWEGAKLQYRCEIFNFMNHPSYTSVNATFGNAAFGQIDGVSAPRYIQMGLKFSW